MQAIVTGIGGLKLTLVNASFLDTGFYVCQNSDGSLVFRRIYLFVQGISNSTPSTDQININPYYSENRQSTFARTTSRKTRDDYK